MEASSGGESRDAIFKYTVWGNSQGPQRVVKIRSWLGGWRKKQRETAQTSNKVNHTAENESNKAIVEGEVARYSQSVKILEAYWLQW